jgi:hypothetical protein
MKGTKASHLLHFNCNAKSREEEKLFIQKNIVFHLHSTFFKRHYVSILADFNCYQIPKLYNDGSGLNDTWGLRKRGNTFVYKCTLIDQSPHINDR